MPTSSKRRVGFQRRLRWGTTAAPKFFERDPATGLQEVAITSDDWGCSETSDGITGEKYLSLELKRVTQAVVPKTVSHVQIGELYYKFKGADRRPGDQNDWVVKIAPSGDKKAA